MLFQRQAGRHIIFHDVLGERHGGKRDRGSSGKSSSLKCGVKSGSASLPSRCRTGRRAGRAPITSSRRAAHNAARRSRPSERNASASASRSMVKRETPAIAAIRSIEEKPLPRAAMSLFISSSLSPWMRRKPRRTACLPRRSAGLQRAIPIAAIDIGGADFDAVLRAHHARAAPADKSPSAGC